MGINSNGHPGAEKAASTFPIFATGGASATITWQGQSSIASQYIVQRSSPEEKINGTAPDGWHIEHNAIGFMPEHRGAVRVKSMDDPIVADVVEKVRKIRGGN